METYHQPLIAISRKCLGETPPRLQRFLVVLFVCFLRLMKYAYHFCYVPGKLLVLADTLSRAPSPRSQVTPVENDDAEVYAVSVCSSVVSGKTISKLKEETAKDPVLSKVMEALVNNQPLINQSKPYTSELSVILSLFLREPKW